LDRGAVSRGFLSGSNESLNVSDELGEVEALTISDDGSSELDDLSQITSAVGDVSNGAELAVFLSRLDVSHDFLDILEELFEVWLARFGLRDDILDLDNHVLDIMNACLDILGLVWDRERAVLLCSRDVSSDLLSVFQDLGEVRGARFGLSDNVFSGSVKVF
jgi:hypothetical protein